MDLSLRRVPGPPCMRLTAVASKHAGNSFGMTKIADACLMCPCLLSTLLEYYAATVREADDVYAQSGACSLGVRTSACQALMMRVVPQKSWCTASITARMFFSGRTTCVPFRRFRSSLQQYLTATRRVWDQHSVLLR